MVIIRVSRSRENARLSTVRTLRRLLRKAFLVTNRVRVMVTLRGEPEARRRKRARPSPLRIDEGTCQRQPAWDRPSLRITIYNAGRNDKVTPFFGRSRICIFEGHA